MGNGIIYLARNNTNGKGYVGQTTKTLDERKKQHFYNAYRTKIHEDGYDGYALDSPFVKAIRKYGISSFDWEVIYNVSKESLSLFEVWAIARLDTYVGDGNGYNATLGGETSPMYNPESVEKMVKAKTGKKLSDETRKKMSDNNARYFLGRHHSNETKKENIRGKWWRKQYMAWKKAYRRGKRQNIQGQFGQSFFRRT